MRALFAVLLISLTLLGPAADSQAAHAVTLLFSANAYGTFKPCPS